MDGISFRLASGQLVDLDDFDPSAVTPFAIARGTANLCRYAGQLLRHYSVAEHQVHARQVVLQNGGHPLQGLAALLHDAPEGLGLADMVGPLKRKLPDYQEIEDKVAAVVEDVFDLPRYALEADNVKAADKAMLAVEQRDLRQRSEWRGEPAKVELACWGPDRAAGEWLCALADAYEQLGLEVQAWPPRNELLPDGQRVYGVARQRLTDDGPELHAVLFPPERNPRPLVIELTEPFALINHQPGGTPVSMAPGRQGRLTLRVETPAARMTRLCDSVQRILGDVSEPPLRAAREACRLTWPHFPAGNLGQHVAEVFGDVLAKVLRTGGLDKAAAEVENNAAAIYIAAGAAVEGVW